MAGPFPVAKPKTAIPRCCEAQSFPGCDLTVFKGGLPIAARGLSAAERVLPVAQVDLAVMHFDLSVL